MCVHVCVCVSSVLCVCVCVWKVREGVVGDLNLIRTVTGTRRVYA